MLWPSLISSMISSIFSSIHRIETKVTIEGLRHQVKKLTGESSNVLSEKNKTLNPSIRDTINDSVKRSIKSQLMVYGNYAEEVSLLKQEI